MEIYTEGPSIMICSRYLGNKQIMLLWLAGTRLWMSLPSPTSKLHQFPNLPASWEKTLVSKWPPRKPTRKNPEAGRAELVFAFDQDWRMLSPQAKLQRCSESVGLPSQEGLGWNVFFKPGHLANSQTLRLVLEWEIIFSLFDVTLKFFSWESREVIQRGLHR